MVGNVLIYQDFYGYGMGRRTGTGSNNFIWDIQNPQQLERVAVVCAARDVSG